MKHKFQVDFTVEADTPEEAITLIKKVLPGCQFESFLLKPCVIICGVGSDELEKV